MDIEKSCLARKGMIGDEFLTQGMDDDVLTAHHLSSFCIYISSRFSHVLLTADSKEDNRKPLRL